MAAPKLDILAPIRATIIAEAAITDALGTFHGGPSVHTRRPVPADAEYPMVAVGPIVSRSEQDGINDFRPVVVVDVTTYGEQPDHYRDVESVAEAIYGLFHRQARAITAAGYSVMDIRCTGPSPGPTDDDSKVARRVTLTIRLYAT